MSGGDVLIRDFRRSDSNDLLDLLPRCFAKEFEISGFDPVHMRGLINRAYGVTGRLFLGSSRILGREPIKFFVAEVDKKVVGTTMVNRRMKVGYISAVMVSPDRRRKGIATKLVKNAVEYIQKRGMNRAALHAVTTNAPAIDAYSKLGFRPFEQVVHMVAEMNSITPWGGVEEVQTRPFRGSDLPEVYALYRESEDPDHLKVFGASKNQLKAPTWLRLFRISTQKRMVAIREGKIVGSVLASYTTPKEAGTIGALHVRPEDRSRGIEVAMAKAAIEAIRGGGIERVVAVVPSTRPEVVETMSRLGFTQAMVLMGMSRESGG